MLIKGYDDNPLIAGEPLLRRPGFWSNHLMAMCGDGAGRPVPEWFGDDGADVDALSEALFDPGHWPVFRIPAAAGHGVAVVYRNLPGDYGIDYPLTAPVRSCADQTARWEGDLAGNGLTWLELVRIADDLVPTADGTEDPAVRLLLLLPLLNDLDVPEAAPARVSAALAATGAPQDTATTTAERLLTHLMGRSRHDPTWGSPLSGGQGLSRIGADR
ncbi:hypothetical protein ACH4M4_32000 [Streptomyces sp. NPDC017254]|uniref:hypothetical protein n=1 Tax=unclassified Streptomyces TaxID=2593676 RepID=UPI0037A72E68